MLEAGLATYRITRLIVADTIFEEPRERVHSALIGHEKLTTLLSCGYCVSVWVAGAVMVFSDKRSLKRLLAISGVAAVAWSVDRIAVKLEELEGHAEKLSALTGT